MDQEKILKELNIACQTDNIAMFEDYIHEMENLESKNSYGWTLLIIAAFAHSYKIVERLIELGADVNASNNKGTTVLMYAKTKVKENYNYSFLDFLIEKGANVFAKDMHGKTVLDYVKETNDLELVQYFESKMSIGIDKEI